MQKAAKYVLLDDQRPKSAEKGPKTPANLASDRGDLTFWTADTGPVTEPTQWANVTRTVFQKRLIAAAGNLAKTQSV
jgi:hypothetical protein